jgi:hypothetical protein
MFENPELAYEMTGERPRSGRDYQKFYGEGIEGFKNFTIETGIGEFETYDISGLEYYWPYSYAWIKDWSMEIHGYINDESNYVETGWAYRNGRWEVDYIILKRFDGGEIVQELSLGQY